LEENFEEVEVEEKVEAIVEAPKEIVRDWGGES